MSEPRPDYIVSTPSTRVIAGIASPADDVRTSLLERIQAQRARIEELEDAVRLALGLLGVAIPRYQALVNTAQSAATLLHEFGLDGHADAIRMARALGSAAAAVGPLTVDQIAEGLSQGTGRQQ